MSKWEAIASIAGVIPIALFLCFVFSDELAKIVRAFRGKK